MWPPSPRAYLLTSLALFLLGIAPGLVAMVGVGLGNQALLAFHWLLLFSVPATGLAWFVFSLLWLAATFGERKRKEWAGRSSRNAPGVRSVAALRALGVQEDQHPPESAHEDHD